MSEFSEAAHVLGKGITQTAVTGTKSALRTGRKHKWIPAAGVGYMVGSQNKGRAANKHPYSGDYYSG